MTKTKKEKNFYKLSHCPNCKAFLKDMGVKYAQKGTMLYDLLFDGGGLNWEEDEFDNRGDGAFYCANCGQDLDLTGEEVIEILK